MKGPPIMEFGLGTVQFGLDYGISNDSGMVPPDRIRSILALARQKGIRVLDTAASYGVSEEAIGLATDGDPHFRIVTKLLPVDGFAVGQSDISRLEDSFHSSLAKLGRSSVAGLLLHRPGNLLLTGGEKIYNLLSTFRTEGLVEKIGISVYGSEEIDTLCGRFQFDIVQAPVNVLDQRLVTGKQLIRLKETGVEIHVRSAFLQGLLLLPPEQINLYFSPIIPLLKQYHSFLNSLGLSPLEGALCFIRDNAPADVVIVGVTTETEFEECFKAFGAVVPEDADFSGFAVDDETMLNPSRWITE